MSNNNIFKEGIIIDSFKISKEVGKDQSNEPIIESQEFVPEWTVFVNSETKKTNALKLMPLKMTDAAEYQKLEGSDPLKADILPILTFLAKKRYITSVDFPEGDVNFTSDSYACCSNLFWIYRSNFFMNFNLELVEKKL